jgi:hypothetical protein
MRKKRARGVTTEGDGSRGGGGGARTVEDGAHGDHVQFPVFAQLTQQRVLLLLLYCYGTGVTRQQQHATCAAADLAGIVLGSNSCDTQY